jgi:Flp pilus assembly protein TadD
MNMNDKSKIKMMIYLSLAGSFFLIFIISCSTMKNGFASKGSKIAQFFSKARPCRGNPDSHYLLACYYQERGRHKEAIEEFKKVLLIDPNYVKALNGLGVSYDLLRDFPKAIEFYEKALQVNLNLDYVQNNLGYSYLIQGNLDEAIIAFRRAIALNDQDKRFHNNLGLAYAEKGEFDLALAEFKMGVEEAKAHYNIAQLYSKKGLYSEAETHYTKALNLNPSFTVIQTGLEAARTLARIFVPITIRPEIKVSKIPDQLIIEKAEAENPINETESKDFLAPDQLPIQWVNITPGQPMVTEQISPLKDVGIEISNGNGVNRMARRVGYLLKEKGLHVIRLTNANHFNYAETKIFYQKEYQEAADYVAGHLPTFQGMEEIKKFDRPTIKIKVLVGKDLIPYNKLLEKDLQS